MRKLFLPLGAGAVALGALIGLPALKALAAGQAVKIMPRAIPQLRPLTVFAPKSVHPSTTRLLAIADQAMSDEALAERIFREPDAVAAEHGLSETEKMVLRHMDREQFATAKMDAERLRTERMEAAGTTQLPASLTDARLIAKGMVVGRAILAAVGRSYLEAANAHACCPWGKAIELGVSPSRVFYNEAFDAPARVQVIPLDVAVPKAR